MKIRILGKEKYLPLLKCQTFFCFIINLFVHARILLEKVRVLESIILKQTAHHIYKPITIGVLKHGKKQD